MSTTLIILQPYQKNDVGYVDTCQQQFANLHEILHTVTHYFLYLLYYFLGLPISMLEARPFEM